MRTLLFAAALAAVPACPPSPAPPDAGDGGAPIVVDAGGSVYDVACATLAAIGCSEGASPTCSATMQKAQTARLVDFHPDCLVKATSKADVRACGPAVKCP